MGEAGRIQQTPDREVGHQCLGPKHQHGSNTTGEQGGMQRPIQRPRPNPALGTAHYIDGGFHCVVHCRLAYIAYHYPFPTGLSEVVEAFGANRLQYFDSYRETETPESFRSRLPQGYPLSTILGLIYASALWASTSHPASAQTFTGPMESLASERDPQASSPDPSRPGLTPGSNEPAS